jgi:TRAP-type C4-dicarboxylate transport system permease small subunit
LVQSLSEKPRLITELFCLLFGTVLVSYATFYAAALLHESWDYGDTSTGIIAIPLWIPQSAMVLGLFILTVALVDTLIETLIAKQPVLPDNGSE